MPAFLSHYACGIIAFHRMEDSYLKECIRKHSGIYSIGLAGPDLFFYSLGEMFRPGDNIGSTIHTGRCGAFLQALYRQAMQLQGERRKTALAYFAGFAGHYCLDTSCHPLVYQLCGHDLTTRGFGKHYRFEAAMDGEICQRVLGRRIDHSHQLGLISCSSQDQAVAAGILAGALSEVFPDCKATVHMRPRRLRVIFKEYRLISSLLWDPSGFKEWLVLQIEKMLLGYPYMSALCINANSYGVTEGERAAFIKRFARGSRFFIRLLPALSAAAEDEGKAEELFGQLGNRSYHTGRDASVSNL